MIRIRRGWLSLLLIALVFCQWLGQSHAVAHFSNAQEHAVTSQHEAPFILFDHVKKSSTCIVLDAVTHGANLHTSFYAADFICMPCAVLVAVQSVRWLPVFFRLFSSRAPPLSC